MIVSAVIVARCLPSQPRGCARSAWKYKQIIQSGCKPWIRVTGSEVREFTDNPWAFWLWSCVRMDFCDGLMEEKNSHRTSDRPGRVNVPGTAAGSPCPSLIFC